MVSPRGPRQDRLLGQPVMAGSALEADHEAPMPGHPTRGGNTRQGSPVGASPIGPPPQTHCHGDTSPKCIGGDRRTGIAVRRGWNKGIG